MITNGGALVRFTDNFFFITNATNKANNPTGAVIERCYQFVSNKMVRFREEDVTAQGTADQWRAAFVDQAYQEVMRVLQVYEDTNNVLRIIESKYGSIADNKRPVRQELDAFMSYSQPVFTTLQRADKFFDWAYFNQVAGPSTTIKVYKLNTSRTENYATYTFNFPGSTVSMPAQNDICKLIHENDGSDKYTFNVYDEVTDNYVTTDTITSAIASITVDGSTKWMINYVCTRFVAGAHIFIKTAQDVFTEVNSGLGWEAIDE